MVSGAIVRSAIPKLGRVPSHPSSQSSIPNQLGTPPHSLYPGQSDPLNSPNPPHPHNLHPSSRPIPTQPPTIQTHPIFPQPPPTPTPLL